MSNHFGNFYEHYKANFHFKWNRKVEDTISELFVEHRDTLYRITHWSNQTDCS